MAQDPVPDNPALFRFKRETAEMFLTRAPRVVSACLIEMPPLANADGEYPLGYPGQRHDDLTNPNPAYFRHVEWIAKRAQSRGITLEVMPLCPSAAHHSWSDEDLRGLGRYLGRRYAKVKSIRWVKTGPRALKEALSEFETIKR